MPIKDLTGKRFDRLLVLGLSHVRDRKSYWKVQCDCGTIKVVRSDCLTASEEHRRTRSCGCYCKELNAQRVTTHKEAKTKLYHVYHAMKQRCYNPKDKGYKGYGGRGITICPEWLEDYTVFSQWAHENGYKEGLSIERLDVNGNYEPSNCCWIPMNEQINNTRRTQLYTFHGRTMNINQWAKELGINKNTLWHRLRGANPLPVEVAFTRPVKCND